MDMFDVDITDLGNDLPLPGEMVEVLGPIVSVDDQADPAGTIGYEFLDEPQRPVLRGPMSNSAAGQASSRHD